MVFEAAEESYKDFASKSLDNSRFRELWLF